jgi:hypothetical protein
MKIKLNNIPSCLRRKLLIVIMRTFIFLFFTSIFGFTSNNVLSQYPISGIVTDESGQPLPGASVVEKGTDNGVQTDFDGNFSIEVTDENATLVISYLGFTNKEVTINNQSTLTIQLSAETSVLEDLIQKPSIRF